MKRIPKIPQGEMSSIKDLLYPDLKPKDKKWELKNLNKIKVIEEKNKKLKEEQQNNNIQYEQEIKNKYKNIPSKLKTDTKIWINKEQRKNNMPRTPLNKTNQRGGSSSKAPLSNNNKKPISLPTINKEEENIYDILNNKKETMFDKYYSTRIRSKTPSMSNHVNMTEYNYNNNNALNINNINPPITPFNMNKNINYINNINDNYNDNINYINEINSQRNTSQIHNNSSSFDKSNITDDPKTNDSNEIERLIQEYKMKYGTDEALENMIKDYKKNNEASNDANLNCIPEVEEKLESTMKKKNNLLLPKIQKNYIKQNKKLVAENKIPLKHKNNEVNNSDIKHKNYGKVPSYIKRYELEREIKKEEIKRQKELEKIPKGTKLLTEEERVNTLNGLINTKKELINQLEKMPITTRTMAVQNKKDELAQKLDEIEKAIEMFSKKQVFIQV